MLGRRSKLGARLEQEAWAAADALTDPLGASPGLAAVRA